jgi:hypothetical protein
LETEYPDLLSGSSGIRIPEIGGIMYGWRIETIGKTVLEAASGTNRVLRYQVELLI